MSKNKTTHSTNMHITNEATNAVNTLMGEMQAPTTETALKKLRLGDIVLFAVNGDHEGVVNVYPALVTELKGDYNASLTIFRPSFVEHKRNVPQSENIQAGFFTFPKF